MGSPPVDKLPPLVLAADRGPANDCSLLRLDRRGDLAPLGQRPPLAVAAFDSTAARLACPTFVHCTGNVGPNLGSEQWDSRPSGFRGAELEAKQDLECHPAATVRPDVEPG